jgi:hypothetical protein
MMRRPSSACQRIPGDDGDPVSSEGDVCTTPSRHTSVKENEDDSESNQRDEISSDIGNRAVRASS